MNNAKALCWMALAAAVTLCARDDGTAISGKDPVLPGVSYYFGRLKARPLEARDPVDASWTAPRPAPSHYARSMQRVYYSSFVEPVAWPEWMHTDGSFRCRDAGGRIDPALVAEIRAATQAVADPRLSAADKETSSRRLRELSEGMPARDGLFHKLGPELATLLGRNSENPMEVLWIRGKIESAQVTFLLTAEGRRPKLALKILASVFPGIDEATAQRLLRTSTDDLFLPAPELWVSAGMENYKTWKPPGMPLGAPVRPFRQVSGKAP